MKMTNKIGISLIGLCALLLLGSPVYAGIWTTVGGACVPNEDSAGRINLYAGMAHESGEFGTIRARCNIVDIQGDDEWQSLGISYLDPDGTGENYRVRVSLVGVGLNLGAASIITTFDSNKYGSFGRTFESYAFDHDFDFSERAYYLYVVLFRADDDERPEFLRAEISSREAPPENEPPIADFSFETDGLTANFTDESTDSDGEVVAWSWDFGDGAGTSTDQNPSYTYEEEGTYTVTLTVTDDQETESEPAEDSVAVSAPPSGDVVQVFVTAASSFGNLGGLAGADAFCQDAAEAAGLTGTWTAWLSTTDEPGPGGGAGVDAIDRIPDGRYELVDGTLIADDKDDLTSIGVQKLKAPINLNEFGEQQGALVWTGTTADGTRTETNCSNWTSAGSSFSCSAGDPNCADFGNNGAITSNWTQNFNSTQCSQTDFHLYCFGGGE